jgi:tetratricopeptide (TPR) repeat protein
VALLSNRFVLLLFGISSVCSAQSWYEWEKSYRCGQDYYQQRRLALAEQGFLSAQVLAQAASEPDWRLGATLGSLGIVLREQGRINAVETALHDAIQAYGRCNHDACTIGIARGIRNLAILNMQQNRFFNAERLLNQTIRLYNEAHADAASLAEAYDTFGWLELYRQHSALAEAQFRKALLVLGDEPHASQTRANLYAGLSAALHQRNRDKEAVKAAQQALAANGAAPNPDPSHTLTYECRLAAASTWIKDYAGAESSLIRAEQILANLPEVHSYEMADVLSEYANLRFSQKRFREAADFQSRALEALAEHLSPDNPQILILKTNYASTLRKLDRKEEAAQVEQQVRNAAQVLTLK